MLKDFFTSSSKSAVFVWESHNKASFTAPHLVTAYGNTGNVIARCEGFVNNIRVHDESNSAIVTVVNSANIMSSITNLQQTCDVVRITITLEDTSNLSRLYFRTASYSFSSWVIVGSTGYANIPSATKVDAYWYETYVPITENIFKAENLQELLIDNVLGITNLDERFFSLSALKKLHIGFSTNETLSGNFFLGTKNLEEFRHKNYQKILSDNTISIPLEMQVNVKLVNFGFKYYNFNSEIPSSLANLNLKQFVLDNCSLSTSQDNILNYPLRSNQNNNVLELLQIIGYNQPTAFIVKYDNIEKLTVLDKISHNVIFSNQQKNIDQLAYFYELVFSKCYYKQGNSFSDASLTNGYFSTLTSPPSTDGWVHPTFRNLHMNDNNSARAHQDSATAVKITELQGIGMILTGNQLI